MKHLKQLEFTTPPSRRKTKKAYALMHGVIAEAIPGSLRKKAKGYVEPTECNRTIANLMQLGCTNVVVTPNLHGIEN